MRKKNLLIHIILFLICCIIFISCKTENQNDLVEQSKSEIRNTEIAFAKLAKDQGVKTAFLKYASDEAVLNRRNKLIKGKTAIKEYFEKQTLKNIKLEWEPDFIDVSQKGDLGYTYGKYIFEATDSTGKVLQDTGIFHTVWKKQDDGSWKFVWD